MKRVFILGIVLWFSFSGIFAQPPQQTPKRVRVGGQVMKTRLLHETKPKYPQEAKSAGIQGTVRLEVLIGREGNVQETKLLSGHEILAKAAMKAVLKWRYKPILINGKPVEIVTEVDVNFTLAGSRGAGATSGGGQVDLIGTIPQRGEYARTAIPHPTIARHSGTRSDEPFG